MGHFEERKALLGSLLCIFSSLTCHKKPVFSKPDLLWWKVPARLYWDLLTSRRYLQHVTISKKWKNLSSALHRKGTLVQVLLWFLTCSLGLLASDTGLKSWKGLYSGPSPIQNAHWSRHSMFWNDTCCFSFFLSSEYWLHTLWPKNSVQHFLWMKAETLIWLCGRWCRSCCASRMRKSSFTCFSVFGLVCCFAGYCGVALVTWLWWWSGILATQWTIFMSSVNHGSGGWLVLSFQRSKGMWIMQNYMKLAKNEEWRIFLLRVGEAKFLFY